MAGGSHNRKTKDSLSHVQSSEGKFKVCKCPLHRNNGKGTVLPQTKFKRHTKDGTQGMCAEGKTLIDSYSHMLKRLQLLAVVSYDEVKIAFKKADKKYKPIVKNIDSIIKEILQLKNRKRLIASEFKLFLLTELDNKLKTYETGFYDIDLTANDKILFNEFLKTIFTEYRINLMEKTQLGWTRGCFIKDSKDGKLYPIEEFVFNVSKKRELYNSKKELTNYRVNIHNTRAKGQRSSTLRGEKYLADGEYTEANRRMKEIGKGIKKIHADHFVPLALGGIHDAKNLEELSSQENIYKKDKLIVKAFDKLKKDDSLLSKWHREVFNKNKTRSIEVVQEILKTSVFELRNRVMKMNDEDKFNFIQNVYPHYKVSQIKRIITKHFTAHDN